MRGHPEETISLFSYVSIKERIPDKHPLRRIRLLANEALKRLDRTLEQFYASADHPPSKVVTGAVAASHLQPAFQATLVGVIERQTVVPLVCGSWSRRSPLASLQLQQEPGATVEREDAVPFPGEATGYGGGEAATEQRPLLYGKRFPHPPQQH